jgi:hypothetical protein
MPLERRRGNIEFGNPVRDYGECGTHALFDPNVNVIFTAFDLSPPIAYVLSRYQIASR